MKSLFTKETSQEFISRINKLSNQTPAQWGKMNVAQMLTHTQKALQVASGELVPKPNAIIKFLFGKSAKKQLMNNPEFKKNLPTFSEAKIVDQRIFDTEKQKLITLIENFQAKGVEGLTKDDHPFFGKMSTSDWDTLQVKHLDHHLRQFGV
jgi:Protein of unknown function (DUF1569)